MATERRLDIFLADAKAGEFVLDSNDIFRELRKAQKVSDMVNNRSKEGRRPITEDDLRLLQHHLNRQKKKISHLGKLMRQIRASHPEMQFYISPIVK
jgi:hypothetical protein